MRFEKTPQFNREQETPPQETIGSKVETRERKITVEQEAKVVNLLKKKLHHQNKILTDIELTDLVRQVANEADIEEDIFINGKDRPLVFYRAFRATEDIKKWTTKDENIQRPFSYAMAGIVAGEDRDLPLSYGGENPILIRIVDTGSYWEDTGPYWGFSQRPGTWNEAMNLNPTVLRKVDERLVTELEARQQIGQDFGNGEIKFREITYIVDRLKTEALSNDPNNLDPFLDDAGFWNELKERAINFRPSGKTNEYSKKLAEKYLEYFNKALHISETRTRSEDAKQALSRAQIEIYSIVYKAEQEDSGWTIEERQQLLRRFSDEAYKKYTQWKTETEDLM